jgi:hypothetical protein
VTFAEGKKERRSRLKRDFFDYFFPHSLFAGVKVKELFTVLTCLMLDVEIGKRYLVDLIE